MVTMFFGWLVCHYDKVVNDYIWSIAAIIDVVGIMFTAILLYTLFV